MYYVTALQVPVGGTGGKELPTNRVEMAKYFTLKDAEDHAEKLRGPGFYDIQIEPRQE
jgi:hypothetical protein